MIKELFKKFTDIVYLNFLWLLASFFGLLITFGASTTAMFRVAFQILKTKEPTNVFNLFLSSFKENFKESTLVWFILVLLGAPIYMMYHYAINESQDILMIIAIFASYEWVIMMIYIFPTIANFKTKHLGQLIKNVLLLSNVNIWTNIKLLGSLAVLILLMFIHSSLLLFAVGLYGVLVSYHLQKVFHPYKANLGEIEEGNEEDEVLKF
jgi:uncharacterized membrane protein YesL